MFSVEDRLRMTYEEKLVRMEAGSSYRVENSREEGEEGSHVRPSTVGTWSTRSFVHDQVLAMTVSTYHFSMLAAFLLPVQ